jgi:hypothetical protein
MAVDFNHTIVGVRDGQASATFLSEVLGLPSPRRWGPFLVVTTASGTNLDLGCWLSINPDAHSTAEIDLTKWGVAMARKGGVSPDRVLNALDLTAFRAHIEARNRSKFRENNLAPRASVPSF